MKLEELIERVKPDWRPDFLSFIETGEAQEAFLTYLDHDADAEAAVELAFSSQATAFEKLGRELSAPSDPAGSPFDLATSEPAMASAKIRLALEDALRLPSKDYAALIDQMAEGLKAERRPDERKEISTLLEGMARAVRR
jgi:hypothetical protein